MKSELIELKIKRKQLASEAKDIRKEERKALAIGRRELSRTQGAGISDKGRDAYRTFERLSIHRKHNVRGAARSAHLAHAFITGRAYADVERTSLTSPSVYGLCQNIRRFHPSVEIRKLDKDKLTELVLEWINRSTSQKVAAE